ncbi:MAG: hypothetical protein ACQES9_09100 [Myxococcota bacterium]
MKNLDNLSEKTEIILGSKQLVSLALTFVVITFIAFIIGFFAGKKSERRNQNLGGVDTNQDLLAKLDKLENMSKNFMAKRRLTNIRKRKLSLDDYKARVRQKKEKKARKTMKSGTDKKRAKQKKNKINLALIRQKKRQRKHAKIQGKKNGQKIKGNYKRSKRTEKVAFKKIKQKKIRVSSN